MNRLMFRSLITAFALFVLFCVPSIASADGVSWTFSGVTFDDGGTVSGSFNYDALSNTYSAIDITTSATTVFAGAHYTSLSSLFSSSSTGMALGSGGDLTDTAIMLLYFADDLTNSGGIDLLMTGDVDGGVEGTCNNVDCSDSTALRSITAGEVVGTVPTPEPSALSLLGIGLLALLSSVAIRKVSQV